VIWATIPISNTDGDPQSWGIELRASSGAVVGGAAGRIGPLDGANTQMVPVLATCESSATTTITFRGFGYNIIMFPNSAGRTCMIVAMPAQII
jgi:hypothetical protein